MAFDIDKLLPGIGNLGKKKFETTERTWSFPFHRVEPGELSGAVALAIH